MLERVIVSIVVLSLLSCAPVNRGAENNKPQIPSLPQQSVPAAVQDQKKAANIPSKPAAGGQKKKTIVSTNVKPEGAGAAPVQGKSPFDWQAAPVLVKPCPFSCDTLGSSRANCKEWQNGNLCFVQDLRRKEPIKESSSVIVPCQLHIDGENAKAQPAVATRPFDIDALAAIVKEADRVIAEAKRAGGRTEEKSEPLPVRDN